MLRKPTSKEVVRWTIIILIAAIVAAYVLLCAFFLLISWVAKDYQYGWIGWGMAAAPTVIMPTIGTIIAKTK